MSDTSQVNSLVQISVLPLIEEETNMETLSLVEDVRMDVWAEVSQAETFTAIMGSDNTRDGGIIFLLTEMAREAIAHKELVLALFRAGTVAINALAKYGHVKSIEIMVAGDSLKIEDADHATVEKLIGIFEATHPGKIQQLPPTASIQVIGTVSKIE